MYACGSLRKSSSRKRRLARGKPTAERRRRGRHRKASAGGGRGSREPSLQTRRRRSCVASGREEEALSFPTNPRRTAPRQRDAPSQTSAETRERRRQVGGQVQKRRLFRGQQKQTNPDARPREEAALRGLCILRRLRRRPLRTGHAARTQQRDTRDTSLGRAARHSLPQEIQKSTLTPSLRTLQRQLESERPRQQ